MNLLTVCDVLETFFVIVCSVFIETKAFSFTFIFLGKFHWISCIIITSVCLKRKTILSYGFSFSQCIQILMIMRIETGAFKVRFKKVCVVFCFNSSTNKSILKWFCIVGKVWKNFISLVRQISTNRAQPFPYRCPDKMKNFE